MANDAQDVWKKIYNQGRSDNAPWLSAGQGGIDQLALLLGLGGDENDPNYGWLTQRFGADQFEEDPGYQFRLNQGEKGINRAAAARGGYLAPQTVKDLGQYNQDYATNEWTNSYNRFNNDQNSLYSRLMGVSGQGQQAAGINANVGMNYANGMSNLYLQEEALRQAKKASKFGAGDLFGGLSSLAGGYFGGGGTLAGLLG